MFPLYIYIYIRVCVRAFVRANGISVCLTHLISVFFSVSLSDALSLHFFLVLCFFLSLSLTLYIYCDGKLTKIPKRDFIFARVKTGQVGT